MNDDAGDDDDDDGDVDDDDGDDNDDDGKNEEEVLSRAFFTFNIIWFGIPRYFQRFLGGCTLSHAPHCNFLPNDLSHYQEQLPN